MIVYTYRYFKTNGSRMWLGGRIEEQWFLANKTMLQSVDNNIVCDLT